MILVCAHCFLQALPNCFELTNYSSNIEFVKVQNKLNKIEMNFLEETVHILNSNNAKLLSDRFNTNRCVLNKLYDFKIPSKQFHTQVSTYFEEHQQLLKQIICEGQEEGIDCRFIITFLND